MADDSNGIPSEIVEAIALANVKVLAEAPAFAMAGVYQTAGNATGLAINNATTIQGFTQILGLVATVKGGIEIFTAKSS